MNLSYWEHSTWLRNIDYAIIGSGIVGLSCALALRDQHPKSKIVIFEKGILPSGASTKNAGFACFGSLSEILDDLESHTEEEVIQLVRTRLDGLKLLRKTLGDDGLRYKEHGGYELFKEANTNFFEKCLTQQAYVNDLLHPIFQADVFSVVENTFNFGAVQPQLIFNQFEGQLDTGHMMSGLLQKAIAANIFILNSAEVTKISEGNTDVSFQINNSLELRAQQLCIATNGFASQLLDEKVVPARAQVLVTKPIENLHIKGTFHLEKGYYYFRNIDNRILLGGGRNLDFDAEQTSEMGLTELVQNTLEELLSTTILPNRTLEIEDRWSGIMGVGPQKRPIVKQISEHIYCGVRLGGMGVAIGSSVGKKLADLI